MTAVTPLGSPPLDDAWAWWRARRMAYNASLAVACILAYAANVAVFRFGFQRPIWMSVLDGRSMPLVLGGAFLILMGAANICFLLGPLSEAWLQPHDRETWRRTSWGLGLGGSLAVPFLYPVAKLAVLFAQ